MEPLKPKLNVFTQWLVKTSTVHFLFKLVSIPYCLITNEQVIFFKPTQPGSSELTYKTSLLDFP